MTPFMKGLLGKLGCLLDFFDYTNFRLPLSSFLVDILRHFRINISQLSMIGAAKISHFEILCRVYEIVPTGGLFHCFYNDHFLWVDSFACPTLFPWHTTKNVTRDPAPVAADFNAQDYATLVAHLSPFRKFPEEFLYLVGLSRHYTLDDETYPRFLHKNGEDMDLFAFIHTLDPIKMKVVKRDELETSIDKLFDKGGNGIQAGQGDSPKRQRKKKTIVADAGGSSHPPKKLREDHGTLSGPSVPGKSRSAVQRLLVRAMLNAEVRGEPIPTLPFVTSSVSATPEHSSHHSGANAAEAEVDSLVRSSVPVMTDVTITTSTADPAVVVKEKTTKPSLFAADSSSAGEADPNAESLRSSMERDQWSRLDEGRVCGEMVDEFAPPKFFPSVQGMKHDQLFTEFNVGAAHQMSLSAEVRMRAEYNIKEKRRLMSAVDEKNELLKVNEKEVEDLKARLLLNEANVAEAIRLRAEASKFEAIKKSLQDKVKALKKRNASLKKERDVVDVKVTGLEASTMGKYQKLSSYENLTEWLEEFQDARLKIVNDKLDKLCADFVEMALHLEEMFYPHLLTTISGHRWLLTHGMELAITKCLHSPKYLSALEAAIGKAIKKGMQDGLSAEITHGAEGRVLIDVAAYNTSTENDYISALRHLQNVNFSLLAELRCKKDASVDTLMNILRLEETLVERLGLTESQPHVDQLMVPIHHLSDKVVLSAIALSLALDVSNIRVLTGTKGTSNTVPATSVSTMALSTTLASTSIVPPISVDDYEVAGMMTRRVRMGMRIPFLITSVTLYGPSNLGPSFPVSSARLASLLQYTRSTFAVLGVGMPISAGMTASVLYVNENQVSPSLDFIIVRCAHRT
uniref:Transposase (putative) gypsy type domain-containing protein n=1 Tax=Tanacetum cinerariifolium TaxID=118510 RepID=A0A699GRD9_TANCI|nr:hypothetical protein [Tanacetum cinerariifolium]